MLHCQASSRIGDPELRVGTGRPAKLLIATGSKSIPKAAVPQPNRERARIIRGKTEPPDRYPGFCMYQRNPCLSRRFRCVPLALPNSVRRILLNSGIAHVWHWLCQCSPPHDRRRHWQSQWHTVHEHWQSQWHTVHEHWQSQWHTTPLTEIRIVFS